MYPAGMFVVTDAARPVTYTAYDDVGSTTYFLDALLSGLQGGAAYGNTRSRSFGFLNAAAIRTYNRTFARLNGSYESMYVQSLLTRHRPYVMVGGDLIAAPENVIFVNTSEQPAIAAFPLKRATAYSAHRLELDAKLAHLTHAAAAYASYTFGATSTRRSGVACRVLSDSTELASLAVKSMNTFQFPTSGDLDGATAASDTVASLQWAIEVAKSGPVVLMAAFSSSDVAVGFAAFYANMTALVPSQVRENLLILAPWSPAALHQLRFGANAVTQLPPRSRMVFTTPLPAFWDDKATLRSKLAEAFNTTDPRIVEDPRRVDAFLFVRLIAEITASFDQSDGTAATLLRFLYSGQQLVVDNAAYGPLYMSNCTDDVVSRNPSVRGCQCNEMRQRIFAFDYSDWLSAISNSTYGFAHQLDGCGGPLYQPLVAETASSLDTAAVGGGAGGGGAALIAVLLISVRYCGGRRHRAAPKDPNAPFAMVFTDIQSSTALWARAPGAMADAVEQHHDIIRCVIQRRGGYEVKTIGDSFMVAFKKAGDAIRFALETQQDLFDATWPPEIDDLYRELDRATTDKHTFEPREDALYERAWNGLRVRVGMHWGVGSIKLDPVSTAYDYYGTVVNTAARVEGVGHGGQILCTKALYDELELQPGSFHGVMNETLTTPLGPQPLRGLEEPLPLMQFVPAALSMRHFAGLRLDIENDIETETFSQSQSVADSCSTLNTPDAVARRFLKGGNEDLIGEALHCAEFILSLFATSKEAWRQTTLKCLCKSWRIHLDLPTAVSGTAQLQAFATALASRALLSVAFKVDSASNRLRENSVYSVNTSQQGSSTMHVHDDHETSQHHGFARRSSGVLRSVGV